MIRIARLVGLVASVALLTACGGDSGSSDEIGIRARVDVTNFSVSAGASPKALDFSWSTDSDETVDHYRLEVNPDGASGFTAVTGGDNITTRSFTLTEPVHLTDWVNAEYRVVALDNSNNVVGASATMGLLDHVQAEEVTGYFKASNTDGGDRFGDSVALSEAGDTLAVGASNEASGATGINDDETDNSADAAGAVYVFTRSGGTWEQQAYIKGSNTEGNDFFGKSVALSDAGDTLAVGADGEASSATDVGGDQTDDNAVKAGAVYVFTRSSGTWSQQTYVKASNTEQSDGFGTSVALSGAGDTLAVGAEAEDSDADGVGGDQSDNNAELSGAVYVFTRNSGTWSQQAYIKASNSDGDQDVLGKADRFGYSVALSETGDTLAVGAYGEESSATGIGGDQTDNSAEDAGAVYIFTRSSSTWSQQAYVKASNTDANDEFGADVALSDAGDTLAVSAWGEESSATGIGGDQTDNSASGAGAVYVFTRSSDIWSQQAYVKASNTEAGDDFGADVALSDAGDKLAVGADLEDSGATGIGGDQTDNSVTGPGAVYVFTRSGGAWSQMAYVKPSSSPGEYDLFGYSVTLSGPGDTLAVGAQSEASSATGIGGDSTDNSADNAGAVFLY